MNCVKETSDRFGSDDDTDASLLSFFFLAASTSRDLHRTINVGLCRKLLEVEEGQCFFAHGRFNTSYKRELIRR